MSTFVEQRNVQVLGNSKAPETLVFPHGFGSQQSAWRFVLPAFEEKYRLILFDLIGSGFLDDGDYIGGFSTTKVTKILEGMATNYATWIRTYASSAMNNPKQPFLAEEFAQCLLKLRPDVTLLVFNMIISSDYRREVAKLELPTLIIQPQDDIFVPNQVGEYLHQAIKNSQLCKISTQGHFPHMSNPSEIIEAISDYLSRDSFS